jgi:hypothetical protein
MSDRRNGLMTEGDAASPSVIRVGAARIILCGIEPMQMKAKGQMKTSARTERSGAEQFYDLAV